MFDRRSFLRAIGAASAAAPLVANPLFDTELRLHNREVTRNLLAGHFEPAGPGELYLPKMKAKLGGYFRHRAERSLENLRRGFEPFGGAAVACNLVVDSGLDRIMQSGLSAYVGYVGIGENEVDPAADLTAGTAVATLGEFTNYTQANRILWAKDAFAAQTYVNAVTPALFTMDTGGGDIWNAFLTSANGKEATTGTFVAASKFDAVRSLLVGDKLYIEYGLTLAAAA